MCRSGGFDGFFKKPLHLIPQMTAVSNPISNPRNVGVAQ